MKSIIFTLKTGLETISALSLFVLMMVTAIDVAGRYFFNAPLLGSYELSEFIIGIVAAAALPLVTYDKSHVKLALLDGYLPAPLRAVREGMIVLLFVVAGGVLGWRLWVEAQDAVRFGAASDALRIPDGPVIFFIAAMFYLVAVMAAIRLKLRPRDRSVPRGGGPN